MDVHIARTGTYADSLLAATNQLDEVLTTFKKQGQLDF